MYRWVRQHYQFQLRGRRFLEAPWSGGLVLLFSVAVAMLLANLPWTAEYYQRVLNIDIALVVRGPGSLIDWMFPRGLTLQTFVNDGLMVVFFFLIGLEIKREIVIGQLSSVRKAILPVLAALGGMVVPALIYFSFNAGTVAAPGWGIPTATDIAFAIGILSIFTQNFPDGPGRGGRLGGDSGDRAVLRRGGQSVAACDCDPDPRRHLFPE